MGQERAYFFLLRMCERHNRRLIGDRVLKMNAKELSEVSAAYSYQADASMSADERKRELTRRLLASEQKYDLAKLDAHRTAVAAAKAAAATAAVEASVSAAAGAVLTVTLNGTGVLVTGETGKVKAVLEALGGMQRQALGGWCFQGGHTTVLDALRKARSPEMSRDQPRRADSTH